MADIWVGEPLASREDFEDAVRQIENLALWVALGGIPDDSIWD